jgi:O-antigen/teichoic acid export membrane protein
MLNVLGGGFCDFRGHRLVVHKREKQYLFGVFSGAMLNLVLNLLLLKTHGPIVASLATVASEFWSL